MTRKRKEMSQKNQMYLLEYYVWWVSLPLGGIPLCVLTKITCTSPSATSVSKQNLLHELQQRVFRLASLLG